MIQIRIATKKDRNNLIPLVGEYHLYESIDSSFEHRKNALSPLLAAHSLTGFILIAESGCEIIGYIAVCFGYSIEFNGYDAFVDEFYLIKPMRSQGIGSRLIDMAKTKAKQNNIRALHLEVARDNNDAEKFYRNLGFAARERFQLMSCVL